MAAGWTVIAAAIINFGSIINFVAALLQTARADVENCFSFHSPKNYCVVQVVSPYFVKEYFFISPPNCSKASLTLYRVLPGQ